MIDLAGRIATITGFHLLRGSRCRFGGRSSRFGRCGLGRGSGSRSGLGGSRAIPQGAQVSPRVNRRESNFFMAELLTGNWMYMGGTPCPAWQSQPRLCAILLHPTGKIKIFPALETVF